MINIFGLSGLLTGITSLVMGGFVLSKGPTRNLNRLWFAFTGSVAIWGFGVLWVSIEKNPATALLAWRLAFGFGVIWIPVLFYHFVLIFCDNKQDRFLLFHYALGVIFSLFSFFSPWFHSGVRFVFSSFYYIIPGALFYPYFVWWAGLVFYAHYQIYRSYLHASAIKRNQFKYILIAFVLSYGTGALAYLPTFGIDVYPYGTFGIMFYPIIVTYAIISYRLMEIETVGHKTAAWLAASFAIMIPVAIIFYFGHPFIENFSPIQLALFVSGMGALLIPYAKTILPIIDHFFERRKYDLIAISQQFTRDVTELKTPSDLIAAFQSTIATVLYPENMSLIFFNMKADEIQTRDGFSLDPSFQISEHQLFLAWLKKNNIVADREIMSLYPEYEPIREAADQYFSATQSEVIVPMIHNQKMFGVIHLGRKKNLHQYTKDEMHFLCNLKIQGTVALSNALLYNDVQQMTRTLQEWATELETRVENRTRALEESHFKLEDSYVKLQEMDRLKTRFFANISHELRTPLTLLVGPINMLLEKEFGDITQRQEEYLKIIQTHSNRLLRLINTLLNLSKSDAGKSTLLLEKRNFVSFARQIIDSISPLIKAKSLHISFEAEETIPEFFFDAGKIEDVILNLLSNALKFTENGKIIVSCEQDQEDLVVQVSDTGMGISKDAIPKLFDRFYQVDSAASRVGAGTGIGLSLVQEWVHLHQGKINVQSEEGVGSTFSFTIPLRMEGISGAILRGDSSEPATGALLQKLESHVMVDYSGSMGLPEQTACPEGVETILIIDDSSDMLRFMFDQLKDKYRLIFAQDGDQGVYLAQTAHPDLIISDVMMPGKSGYHLCRELKNDPQTAGIPIIFLTAKGTLMDKIEGLEYGADDYLTKPFSKEELLLRTHSLIHKRELQKEVLLKNKELEEVLEELKRVGMNLIQSEKMTSLGLLVSGIAHELNNPISFSKGSILLANNLCDTIQWHDVADSRKFSEFRGELKDALYVAKTGLGRMEEVVKDLSSFVRKDQGTFIRLNLNANLDLALSFLRYEWIEGVEIIRAYENLDGIEAVPSQMNQSFLNIFQNALHAMKNTTNRKLFVTTRLVNDTAVVSIRDTGIGILESNLSRLFEPFFTTKEVGRGVGLGLSLVYKMIVGNHHGTIDVNSKVSEGTEFIVTLPMNQPVLSKEKAPLP
ncbi:MAG: ATP-binding protein [Nitrospirota bacterium]